MLCLLEFYRFDPPALVAVALRWILCKTVLLKFRPGAYHHGRGAADDGPQGARGGRGISHGREADDDGPHGGGGGSGGSHRRGVANDGPGGVCGSGGG